MDAPENSIFSGPVTSIFSAMRFNGDFFFFRFLLHASAKKEKKGGEKREKKRLKGCKFRAFMNRFQMTSCQRRG